ncbi:long-chain-fatty-acid--CoA ligase [Planococcus salinus]|uniref:Long-chain-fatty-acid--CoA ligase n=1 Tax=Planococcus salinus TaxID=1848460 RepID=A0A3M8PBP1_9BACL|nr:long-chain-fatty-acid--CoA ligase [Planococcus salinus]RNF41136.1 long-chain-fatty-acid--CoA ligase [Planococcus salinus]
MLAPLTPIDWKRRAVKYYPEKIAVIDEDKQFTYKEFGNRTDQLSIALHTSGVKPQEHVAVMLPNTHYMLEAFYGIVQLGAVIVPLNFRLSAKDLEYIIRHSDAKTLIVDAEFGKLIEDIQDKLPIERYIVVPVDGHESAINGTDYEAFISQVPEDAVLPSVEIDENSMLSLNYTSGTTSNPKGVMQTHRTNYMNAANFLHHLEVKFDDVYLHTLPMFHTNGWGGVWAITAAGATHVCLRKVDPPLVLDLFEQHGISVLCGAPTVVNMLVNEPKAKSLQLSRKLRMATAGSPPAAALIAKAQNILGLNMMHVYGLTETSPFILYCEWKNEFDSKSLEEQATIKARQGIELAFNGETKVVNQEDGKEVAWNGKELGEIITRGNVVMKGYYKDPEKTAEAIKDGWFYTGDLAVTHPDGFIEIQDRIKDMIISGGENISSTEIEGVLYKHPDILEVAVIAVPDEKWGEVPKAIVVLRPGADITEQQLLDYTRDQMSRFKVPKSVEFVESLPKTATGKLQKFQLREMYWNAGKKVN